MFVKFCLIFYYLIHFTLGPPDTGTSLLHQKLQMLNCCIAKRQSKEKSGKFTSFGSVG